MNPPNTRQRILDAAQRLIEADGIARLTTRDIAREAACAEGTLFKYFKRKDDLCLAVVLENSPQFREHLAAVRPGSRTVKANLLTIGLAAIHFFKKLVPLAVSLFADAELLTRHRKTMQQEGRGPQDVFELVTEYIRAEQQAHRIDARISPVSAASLLLGACFQRAFIRQAMGKQLFPLSDEDFLKSLLDTLLRGLSTKKLT